MQITAPRRGPVKAVVYEPAQSQDQGETIIEEFYLKASETVDRNIRSATAAVRFLDLSTQEIEEHKLGGTTADPREIPPQEGVVSPITKAELDAGKKARDAYGDADATDKARKQGSERMNRTKGEGGKKGR